MRVQLRRRRALASLELALALPFLLFMAAAIFKVVEASEVKTDTALRARRDAWHAGGQALAPEESPLPDETLMRAGLGLDGRPGYGMAEAEQSRDVAMRPVAPTSVKVGTRLGVLEGTWDYHSIDFPDRPPMQPHPRAWTVIAVGAVPAQASEADVNAFASMFDVSRFDFNSQSSKINGVLEKALAQIYGQATGLGQYEDILNAAKNPAKFASSLGKLGDAIDNLGKAPDSLGDLGHMFGEMATGIQSLRDDLGVDVPALDQMQGIAEKVGDVADKAKSANDALKNVKSALDKLKNPKFPKLP